MDYQKLHSNVNVIVHYPNCCSVNCLIILVKQKVEDIGNAKYIPRFMNIQSLNRLKGINFNYSAIMRNNALIATMYKVPALHVQPIYLSKSKQNEIKISNILYHCLVLRQHEQISHSLARFSNRNSIKSSVMGMLNLIFLGYKVYDCIYTPKVNLYRFPPNNVTARLFFCHISLWLNN